MTWSASSKPFPLLLLGGVTVGVLAYFLKNYHIQISRKPKKMASSTHTQSYAGKVLVASRIHLGQTSKTDMKDFDKTPLTNFIREALTYADGVAVAVGVNDLFAPTLVTAAQDVAKNFEGHPVYIIPVIPWGRFIPALNALLSFAADNGYDFLLYQSIETLVDKQGIEILKTHFNPVTDLVVGAALPGHDFCVGKHRLDGRSSPWNTLALWGVRKLALTGFLQVAEGLIDKATAGIEEVSVIALAQFRDGDGCGAKLVKVPGIKWEVEWNDEGRRTWHEQKMQGKILRSETHMQRLQIPHGTVTHIDATSCST